MKCKVNLKTKPITLAILPQYLDKDTLEMLHRVGHGGMITLSTLEEDIEKIENEK